MSRIGDVNLPVFEGDDVVRDGGKFVAVFGRNLDELDRVVGTSLMIRRLLK
jgi:hypothetical protein